MFLKILLFTLLMLIQAHVYAMFQGHVGLSIAAADWLEEDGCWEQNASIRIAVIWIILGLLLSISKHLMIRLPCYLGIGFVD